MGRERLFLGALQKLLPRHTKTKWLTRTFMAVTSWWVSGEKNLRRIIDVKVIDWSRKERATQRNKNQEGGAFMGLILEVLRLCRLPEGNTGLAKQLRAEYREFLEYARLSVDRNRRGLRMISQLAGDLRAMMSCE